MLSFLRIRNLALIETVDVEFDPGFNVLTGETGAGKSMLVEAVGLLLGGRSSTDLVRTGETAASIEAVFDEGGHEIVVRREITAQGRSRSFVNGALATAGALRDLSQRLVELHGQHEHQALLDPASHLPLLDDYARHGALTEEVATAWAIVAELREQLDRVTMEAGEREARLDLVSFQLGEIEKLSPRDGEDEELRTTRQVLASAERVQRLCDESHSALYESDTAALGTVAAVSKRIAELAGIDPQFEPYVSSLDAIKSQLEDAAWFIRDYGERIESSPERLQQVEDRLAALERLKRKYGSTLADVMEKGRVLARERELLTSGTRHAGDIQGQLDGAAGTFLDAARRLSASRRAAAVRFSGELQRLLADLAMGRTQFDVRFNAEPLAADAWGSSGIDRAEFFISPNPGEELRALTRIASGGELSRIMLALKTLSAHTGRQAGTQKTLIFDEVDAGIGGQVADVLGRRLHDLGGEFQVLCITHLPQIAARAMTHFRISKAVRRGRTLTSVERLTPSSRVDEVARMIAGDAASDAVRASAAEMLSPRTGARTPASGAEAKGESESPLRGESRSRRSKN
jgi:DNA repair protein RecN (Recombination protein N)